MTDLELLNQYREGSQPAFAELVRRHASWIYCVARRRVRDAHLAEDVTQAVFILLAQKAWKLRAAGPLQPWLMKVTQYTCSHALRTEMRRRAAETRAAEIVEQTSPATTSTNEICSDVDQLLAGLPIMEQQILLLRFYGQRTLAEIANEMRLSEEAARKRVSRALDKLRKALSTSAVALPATGMEHWLDHGAVVPAPAHVASSGSAAALAGASGAGQSFQFAKGVNRMFIWSKIRVAAMAAMILILPGILCVHLLMNVRGQDQSYVPSTRPTFSVADLNSGSKNVLLHLSADRNKVWAFSVPVGGDWTQPKPAIPVGAVVEPILTENIAAFRAGSWVYGFSAMTGTWDSMEFNNGVTDNPSISAAQNIAACRAGNRLLAFSATTGKWDSIEIPDGITDNPSVSSDLALLYEGAYSFAFSSHAGKWRAVDSATHK